MNEDYKPYTTPYTGAGAVRDEQGDWVNLRDMGAGAASGPGEQRRRGSTPPVPAFHHAPVASGNNPVAATEAGAAVRAEQAADQPSSHDVTPSPSPAPSIPHAPVANNPVTDVPPVAAAPPAEYPGRPGVNVSRMQGSRVHTSTSSTSSSFRLPADEDSGMNGTNGNRSPAGGEGDYELDLPQRHGAAALERMSNREIAALLGRLHMYKGDVHDAMQSAVLTAAAATGDGAADPLEQLTARNRNEAVQRARLDQIASAGLVDILMSRQDARARESGSEEKDTDQDQDQAQNEEQD
ncbi:hypothetical protein GGR56DRAFT_688287 [Xylariaceae sp. FL0804]|nr:hypothetical protein GGR56DRAFT_688287 [Xylariaceae sp. FL0804]